MAKKLFEKKAASPPTVDEKKPDLTEEDAVNIPEVKEARPQREATFNDYLVRLIHAAQTAIL